jgi:hypothetical protein
VVVFVIPFNTTSNESVSDNYAFCTVNAKYIFLLQFILSTPLLLHVSIELLPTNETHVHCVIGSITCNKLK